MHVIHLNLYNSCNVPGCGAAQKGVAWLRFFLCLSAQHKHGPFAVVLFAHGAQV